MKRDWARYMAATLLTLAITSTAAQYAAAAWWGLPISSSIEGRAWSTGGVVALTASIWIGVKCRSWTDFRRRIVPWVALTAALASLAVTVIGGFSNAYSVEVVDQEARLATSHQELTGRYSVSYASDQLCGDGEDLLSCVNQHVVLYNIVCADRPLTDDGNEICSSLSGFVDEIQAEYDRCGTGCETQADEDGLWGWPYLRLTPETASVSTGDWLPEISHHEHCYFKLGQIQVGSCADDREP